MLTNAHILAINDHLAAARQIIVGMSETDEAQQLSTIIAHITDRLYCISNDMADDKRQIAELNRRLYDPLLQAQAQRTSFSLLTEQCHKDKKAEQVEGELRAACRGTAVGLWKVIRFYEAMGYLSTQHLNAQDVYDALVTHFGPLPFKIRNFRNARNIR